jgi:hypothetical protein
MTLKEYYEQLLILQYYNQPKARGEIGLEGARLQSIKETIDALQNAFELNQATGDRLDKIGKIVGVSRTDLFGIEKTFFGFVTTSESLGFADKDNPSRMGAPFSDKFGTLYTATQLSDADYLLLIKAKIAFNQVSAKMAGDETTINDVIGFLFNDAIVVDRKDMTLTLRVPAGVSFKQLQIVKDLLPTPQGVGYAYFYQSAADGFGFSNNLTSIGFADRFDVTRAGGTLARKVIL